MQNLLKTIGVFCLLTSICFAQSQNTTGNNKVENYEREIDSLFSKYNTETPGVAVAVVKDGKIIFKKGYGSATLEYDVPITSKTIFHVASVSKQFTAFSIYLLEEQGKISLEDDIRRYVPELPDYGKPIKIKHLLAHTSGLRDQWAMLTIAGWQMEDVITTDQILKLTAKQRRLNFETGTQFGYCNTAYTLLAETVERITGQTFASYTKENIFDPLEMNDTQFYDDFHKVVKNRAYSYEIKNDTYIKKKLNYSNVGPTSLFTTVEDMAKWATHFKTPIVGNAQLIEEYTKISKLENGLPVVFRETDSDTLYHAKGQLHWSYKGLKFISHGGHDAGFRAFMGRFPENNLTIIALSNDEHYDILKNGFAIADLFLKVEQEKVIIKETPILQKVSDPNGSYNNTLIDFVGAYYSDELTTTYHISAENDTLLLSHQRLRDIALTRTSENNFSGVNSFWFELEFLRNNKEITGFEISNFGAKNVRFVRK